MPLVLLAGHLAIVVFAPVPLFLVVALAVSATVAVVVVLAFLSCSLLSFQPSENNFPLSTYLHTVLVHLGFNSIGIV